MAISWVATVLIRSYAAREFMACSWRSLSPCCVDSDGAAHGLDLSRSLVRSPLASRTRKSKPVREQPLLTGSDML